MVRNPEDMLSHDAAHTDCQTGQLTFPVSGIFYSNPVHFNFGYFNSEIHTSIL